jgi:UDP-N-acetylmuramate-alanine ligase
MNAKPIRSFSLGNTMPLDVGMLHFVGIGGIGMSGIAEVLHNLGYAVQGSDLADNYVVERLRKSGINVVIGAHDAANIAGAAVLVISSAVKDDNPEVREARAMRIPVVRRAEMLAELMRLKATVSIAGTHGKTTTTSLISTLFMAGGKQPTVINGGIINAIGTNAVKGEGDWMVVEADESDGTFIRIPSTIAVVTNIDPEHLDHYGTFEALKAAFRHRLIHRHCRCQHARMGIGNFQNFEHPLNTAILAVTAMQGVKHRVGLGAQQILDHTRGNINRHHAVAQRQQRLLHRRTTGERNFTFGGHSTF